MRLDAVDPLGPPSLPTRRLSALCGAIATALALTVAGGGYALAQDGGTGATANVGSCRGPLDAPVVVEVFADFECPFSAKVASSLRQLQDSYSDDVVLVFRNYPLPFHKHAKSAAKAAIAAGKQGKFWEMHDALFQNHRSLSEERYRTFALELGLDMDRFNTDYASGETELQIGREMAAGRNHGVRGTPTILVNGERANGRTLEAFSQMVEQALSTPPAGSEGVEDIAEVCSYVGDSVAGPERITPYGDIEWLDSFADVIAKLNEMDGVTSVEWEDGSIDLSRATTRAVMLARLGPAPQSRRNFVEMAGLDGRAPGRNAGATVVAKPISVGGTKFALSVRFRPAPSLVIDEADSLLAYRDETETYWYAYLPDQFVLSALDPVDQATAVAIREAVAKKYSSEDLEVNVSDSSIGVRDVAGAQLSGRFGAGAPGQTRLIYTYHGEVARSLSSYAKFAEEWKKLKAAEAEEEGRTRADSISSDAF